MLSTFYVLFVALNVWFAYNLYQPSFKNKRLIVPSFIAGWLVGELALFVVLIQIVLTVMFVNAGAVHGFLGNLALLANVGAWFFYVQHYLAASDTPAVMEDAFKSTFGADYADSISEDVKKRIPEDVEIERLLKPFSLDLPEVERIKNIQYDQQDGINLRLDVYRNRENEGTKKPVLLQIHGGAWTYKLGSKDEQGRPLMNHLAKHGWICVSINYRLSPKAIFPEHIIDCKKALVWIKENIADYGGDPDFVAVTGGSAGGHLSSLLALTANDPNFQPGFEEANTEVQACVPFYGVYDFTNANNLHANNGVQQFVQKSVFKKRVEEDEEFFKQASPIHRIHADAPPFLVIQGDADTLVCGPEAARFASDLKAASKQSVCYVELEGAQHAFDIFVSLRSEHCKHGVHKYLSYVHSRCLAQ